MKKFIAAAGFLAISAATSVAADLPVRPTLKALPPVAIWSWTGFYAGINGGYGVGTDYLSQSAVGSVLGVVDPRHDVTTLNSTIAPKGGLFGFQGGYNYQTGSVVLGVEGDWQWANQTATACGQSCTFSTSPFSGSQTYSIDQKIKWLATARGRVGWTPVDGAMIYATGGGAWMGIDESDAYAVTLNNPAILPNAATAASFGNTRVGYAVGAGAEFRLWGNWTGKLEYLHLDVGGTTNVSQPSAPPSFGPFALTTTTSRIRDDIFRLGLNYRLGPVSAVMASTSSTGFPVKASVSRTTSNWSWTGFYLGINAGYGVATDQFRQTSTNVTSPFPTPLVAGNTVSSTIAPKGGLLGFQGGFNYQTGSVVLGVEGDWQWANQTATACGTSCFFRTTPGFIGTAGNTLSRFEKVAWLATARGRVGWTPIDGAMIYVTGGGAWMGIDESDRLSASDAPFFPDEASAASFSNSVSGYVMGAGAELRLWGNWTGKLEYLHLDVGGTTTSALHSGPNIIGPLVLATATGRIRDDIVRLGLNYKLGSWTP